MVRLTRQSRTIFLAQAFNNYYVTMLCKQMFGIIPLKFVFSLSSLSNGLRLWDRLTKFEIGNLYIV